MVIKEVCLMKKFRLHCSLRGKAADEGGGSFHLHTKASLAAHLGAVCSQVLCAQQEARNCMRDSGCFIASTGEQWMRLIIHAAADYVARCKQQRKSSRRGRLSRACDVAERLVLHSARSQG